MHVHVYHVSVVYHVSLNSTKISKNSISNLEKIIVNLFNNKKLASSIYQIHMTRPTTNGSDLVWFDLVCYYMILLLIYSCTNQYTKKLCLKTNDWREAYYLYVNSSSQYIRSLSTTATFTESLK